MVQMVVQPAITPDLPERDGDNPSQVVFFLTVAKFYCILPPEPPSLPALQAQHSLDPLPEARHSLQRKKKTKLTNCRTQPLNAIDRPCCVMREKSSWGVACDGGAAGRNGGVNGDSCASLLCLHMGVRFTVHRGTPNVGDCCV
jgi:hypothetical protein